DGFHLRRRSPCEWSRPRLRPLAAVRRTVCGGRSGFPTDDTQIQRNAPCGGFPAMNRRAMLLGVAGSAMTARSQTVRLPKKVRLGLIGFDGHPEEILRPLADFPDVELVAVADAESDARAIASSARNPLVAKAHRYPGYSEMLARETLDCVAICNH